MVDKPRRRKENKVNWTKVAAAGIAVLLVGGAGWFVYTNYIYKPPPVYAKITVGYANGTSLGAFEVELFPACAPQTVANFVSLADSGFYTNITWHRIDKTQDFWIVQTGDPNSRNAVNSTRSTWGQGGSPHRIPLEVGACSWIGNYEGYLAMARQGNQTVGLDTGTSQFYINLCNCTANESLNGYYTVFGKVISGMSVVDEIGNAPVYTSVNFDQPIDPILITSVVVLQSP